MILGKLSSYLKTQLKFSMTNETIKNKFTSSALNIRNLALGSIWVGKHVYYLKASKS